MRTQLERVLQRLRAALEAHDADEIDGATRVLYADSLKAIATPNGLWEEYAPIIKSVLEEALASPALQTPDTSRHRANVQARLDELRPDLDKVLSST